MCGIAGFIGPWPGALLDRMVASLRHRGPDGSGRLYDEPGGLGLGHTRLSIIDLSDAAAQPMHSADGRLVISYNGEIYNYRELRRELEDQGVAFRTESDTEVLLHLFARDGLDCVDRLDGIFAFAVWDRHDRRLSLARDHLGVKPLYYADLPTGFLFASELKSLVLCPDVPREIDPSVVADHIGYAWSGGAATMLKAVRKLRPGHVMTVEPGGAVRVRPYYRTPRAGRDIAVADSSPARLAGLIDQVVRDQMVSDVEVGALLSGGLDSSAIVAAMCRATDPARITTFCAAVTDGSGEGDNFGDDIPHAREVAELLGVNLVEVPTGADLVDALPDMLWALDEPAADFAALQSNLLARAARQAGIKVLLSGVGGDDLFTGYGRHTAALLYARLDRIPGGRALAAWLLDRAGGAGIGGRRRRRVAALLRLAEDDMLAEAMSFSAVMGTGRRALLAAGPRAEIPADGIPAPIWASLEATRGMHPVERLLDLELNGFLPDLNLNYTDKMAMLEGVEIRVPLIDCRMVDFAAGLPLDAKIDLRRTKKILRQSQRGRLPDSVLTRPKQGFGVPIRGWLRGPARPLLEDLTSTATVAARGLFDPDAVGLLRADFLARRIDAAQTLFPIMAVELWCRALDAAPVADLS
jgi:asparagine synthase (glutamine-hydrolysing)